MKQFVEKIRFAYLPIKVENKLIWLCKYIEVFEEIKIKKRKNNPIISEEGKIIDMPYNFGYTFIDTI